MVCILQKDESLRCKPYCTKTHKVPALLGKECPEEITNSQSQVIYSKSKSCKICKYEHGTASFRNDFVFTFYFDILKLY